jgi:hypothetical protein
MRSYFTQSPATNCGGYRIVDTLCRIDRDPIVKRVYSSRKAATKRVDALNLEYGAYRYAVVAL